MPKLKPCCGSPSPSGSSTSAPTTTKSPACSTASPRSTRRAERPAEPNRPTTRSSTSNDASSAPSITRSSPSKDSDAHLGALGAQLCVMSMGRIEHGRIGAVVPLAVAVPMVRNLAIVVVSSAGSARVACGLPRFVESDRAGRSELIELVHRAWHPPLVDTLGTVITCVVEYTIDPARSRPSSGSPKPGSGWSTNMAGRTTATSCRVREPAIGRSRCSPSPHWPTYETYRARFGTDPDFIAADKIRDDSGCVLRYDRSFMRPLLA